MWGQNVCKKLWALVLDKSQKNPLFLRPEYRTIFANQLKKIEYCHGALDGELPGKFLILKKNCSSIIRSKTNTLLF